MPDYPACPRCGYDQSGEIARWRESCPLEGVCTECGLTFSWADLLSDRLTPPVWHVEHPRAWMVLRVPGMVRRTRLPGRFWSSVKMEQLRRPGRSVWFAVAGLVFVLLAFAPIEYLGWRAVEVISASSRNPAFYHTPLGYIGNTSTMDTVCDGLVVLGPVAIVQWEPMPVFSRGAMKWTGRPVVEGVNYEALVPMMFVALIPATYFLLPQTLGAARVRPWHLVRAFCTGVPFAVLLMELLLVGTWFVMACVQYVLPWRLPGLPVYIFEGGLVWMVVMVWHQSSWWYAVNRRFLRLEQAGAVTAAMIVIASLVTLIVLLAFTEVGVTLIGPLEGFWGRYWF